MVNITTAVASDDALQLPTQNSMIITIEMQSSIMSDLPVSGVPGYISSYEAYQGVAPTELENSEGGAFIGGPEGSGKGNSAVPGSSLLLGSSVSPSSAPSPLNITSSPNSSQVRRPSPRPSLPEHSIHSSIGRSLPERNHNPLQESNLAFHTNTIKEYQHSFPASHTSPPDGQSLPAAGSAWATPDYQQGQLHYSNAPMPTPPNLRWNEYQAPAPPFQVPSFLQPSPFNSAQSIPSVWPYNSGIQPASWNSPNYHSLPTFPHTSPFNSIQGTPSAWSYNLGMQPGLGLWNSPNHQPPSMIPRSLPAFSRPSPFNSVQGTPLAWPYNSHAQPTPNAWNSPHYRTPPMITHSQPTLSHPSPFNSVQGTPSVWPYNSVAQPALSAWSSPNYGPPAIAMSTQSQPTPRLPANEMAWSYRRAQAHARKSEAFVARDPFRRRTKGEKQDTFSFDDPIPPRRRAHSVPMQIYSSSLAPVWSDASLGQRARFDPGQPWHPYNLDRSADLPYASNHAPFFHEVGSGGSDPSNVRLSNPAQDSQLYSHYGATAIVLPSTPSSSPSSGSSPPLSYSSPMPPNRRPSVSELQRQAISSSARFRDANALVNNLDLNEVRSSLQSPVGEAVNMRSPHPTLETMLRSQGITGSIGNIVASSVTNTLDLPPIAPLPASSLPEIISTPSLASPRVDISRSSLATNERLEISEPSSPLPSSSSLSSLEILHPIPTRYQKIEITLPESPSSESVTWDRISIPPVDEVSPRKTPVSLYSKYVANLWSLGIDTIRRPFHRHALQVPETKSGTDFPLVFAASSTGSIVTEDLEDYPDSLLDFFTGAVATEFDGIVDKPAGENFLDLQVIEPVTVPPQYERLKVTWEAFIDSLLREWKTFNIISALLLTAILTILQIQSASSDPVTRYAALISLICALISLLLGCLYILRFGTMRKTYKAAEWANEAKSTSYVWWNVWILLAMPAIWLTWSIILYILCIMSFIWRADASSAGSLTFSPRGLTVVRIWITAILGLGVIYTGLILITFRRYGSPMDLCWQRRINDWIEDREFRNQFDDYPDDSNAHMTPYSQATGLSPFNTSGIWPDSVSTETTFPTPNAENISTPASVQPGSIRIPETPRLSQGNSPWNGLPRQHLGFNGQAEPQTPIIPDPAVSHNHHVRFRTSPSLVSAPSILDDSSGGIWSPYPPKHEWLVAHPPEPDPEFLSLPLYPLEQSPFIPPSVESFEISPISFLPPFLPDNGNEVEESESKRVETGNEETDENEQTETEPPEEKG